MLPFPFPSKWHIAVQEANEVTRAMGGNIWNCSKKWWQSHCIGVCEEHCSREVIRRDDGNGHAMVTIGRKREEMDESSSMEVQTKGINVVVSGRGACRNSQKAHRAE